MVTSHPPAAAAIDGPPLCQGTSNLATKNAHNFMVSFAKSKSVPAIKSILFPVDFSPSGVAIASFVKRAVSIFSAQATLFYVLEPLASGFELFVRPLPDVEENRKNVVRDAPCPVLSV
jgi:hypothetical protein